MVTIRPPGTGDVDGCVRLAGLFLASSPYGRFFAFKPEAVRELVRRVFADGIAFVAERDGAIVGMIGGFPYLEPFSNTPMLDELAWFVEPGARSSSVGPRLLAAWEAWARQQGIVALRMVAPRGAESVAAFYTRCGYEPIDIAFIKRLDHGTTKLARGRDPEEARAVHPPRP